jgi:Glycosyl hydrolases family 16
MKTTTTQTLDAFQGAWKGGTDRPMQRATIQRLNVFSTQYDLDDTAQLEDTPSGAKGTFTTIPFAQRDQPVELPNIKSIRWQRSVESEVATMTMVLWNCEILPLGQAPDVLTFKDGPVDENAYERPGYFTPTRGEGNSNQEFGQSTNGWQGVLVPDRIIRTYEGYGFDPEATPEADVHMYPSGVWLIDEVSYDARGTITVSARDIGRALLDQIAFPPVVPFDQYPISWSAYQSVDNPDIVQTTQGWFRPTYDTDSNIPYIGLGISDGSYPYVSSTGSVRGHHGKHAFDGSRTTYWMSVGNYPNWSSAYEYVQGKFSSRTVTAVKFKAWGGPYKVFISVFADGAWKGKAKIPYRARQVDTNADIKFVASKTVKKNGEITVRLPKAYASATKVRITFTDLFDSGLGKYQYRAGAYDVQVTGGIATTVDGGQHTEGNYGDYTDIVKWFLAWGGWHWPSAASGNAYLTETDGTVTNYNPVSNDTVLPAGLGRVWGDLEYTGTQGKVDLGIEIFDKKPLLDAIAYVRDIVGYNFFIDETGGAIFRSPNIWTVGNYVSAPDGGENTGRTTDVIDLGDQAIMDLAVKISSKNIREKIFVANVNGRFGAMTQGFNKYPSGLRRVAGWTDQNFETEAECQIMADLIAIRQMFRFRTDTVTIPGNPAIQIDDQVKLHEPITAETYYHYVKSIGSDFDMETGKWTYAMETFWLGETPLTKDWAFNALELAAETIEYLELMGRAPAIVDSTPVPPPTTPGDPPPDPPPSGPGAMTLVLDEQFSAGSLNTSIWFPETGTYGADGNRIQYWRPENVVISAATSGGTGNSLKLISKRENFGGKNFTAGMLGTRDVGVYYPVFGRYEARMKVPHGQGIWPAFWLRHRNGSSMCEVDIMEYFHAQVPGRNLWTLHRTNNSGSYQANVNKVNAFFEAPTTTPGWHVFGVDILPEGSAVRFIGYLDGTVVWNYLDTQAVRWSNTYGTSHPSGSSGAHIFDICLQGAQIGGNYVGHPDDPTGYSRYLAKCISGGSAPNSCYTVVNGQPIWTDANRGGTLFPSTFEVDWVRVWSAL